MTSGQRHSFSAADFPAEELGWMIYAMNKLNTEFASIFHGMVGDRQLANAIWHTLTSDRTQRDVLTNALKVSTHYPDAIKSEYLWAIDQINKVSAFRNAAVHTFFSVWGEIGGAPPTLKPDNSWASARAMAKFRDKDFRQQMFDLAEYFEGMFQYVASVGPLVVGQHELPPRPPVPQSLT